MGFVDDISDYRSLAIVGLEKNTGKTECLNYILRRIKDSADRFALTSIGIDGEGRIKRMSPKGIKKKPSKSFNQDFPTAFCYHYQRVISIIVPSIIYIKIVGKCICIYSMIQCLMHEHTTHAQSILCFDIIYLQVCSFYYVAS